MTVAVLLPGPWPPMAEGLVGQLRCVGAREVVCVEGRADLAAVARDTTEPLLICAGDLVAHDAVVRCVATAPGEGTRSCCPTGRAVRPYGRSGACSSLARRPPGWTAAWSPFLTKAADRVQADTGSRAYWLKRTAAFPIGERWALIALAVGIFDPYVALVAVLVCGAFAFAYTLLLRTMRARTMRVDPFAGTDRALQRDDGPLAAALGRLRSAPLTGAATAAAVAAAFLIHTVAGGGSVRAAALAAGVLIIVAGALPSAAGHGRPPDFLAPATLRAAEYLFVVAVGSAYGVPWPATYALLFALALHHLDLTARAYLRLPPRVLPAATPGWDVRVALLAVVAATGAAAVTTATLAAYVFVIFAVGSTVDWAKAANPARRGVRATTMT